MLHVAQGSNSSEKFGIQSQAVMKTTGKKRKYARCMYSWSFVCILCIYQFLSAKLTHSVCAQLLQEEAVVGMLSLHRGHFKLLCG